MPKILFAGAACFLLVMSGVLISGEPLRSGPQVGDANNRPGFRPKWVAGRWAGEGICPVATKYDMVALVFAREVNDSLLGLITKLEYRMKIAEGKTERPLGVFVMLPNKGSERDLRDIAESESIKHIALGIGVPPKEYEIAPEAEVTVVVYNPGRRNQQKVTANIAVRKGQLDAAKAYAIVKAISEHLPPEVVDVVPTSREKEQSWRYTFTKPADHWYMPDFNDLSWKTGPGGFGNKGTPNAVDRTSWTTEEIWLRREIILPEREDFTNLQLQIHADDFADVYLNGVLATKVTRCTPGYMEFLISNEAAKTLRAGSNVLAVTCRDSGGGRYIDVGLVEPKK